MRWARQVVAETYGAARLRESRDRRWAQHAVARAA
jgi:hypothetical protein